MQMKKNYLLLFFIALLFGSAHSPGELMEIVASTFKKSTTLK